jgi:uncharacterized membrane protein YidH (DUF202 family)
MDDQAQFWTGLQRERTGLAWTRTLEALTAAQVVVAVDGLKTHRIAPTIVGLLLLIVTASLAWWQFRGNTHDHGDAASTPAQRLAATSAALVLLAIGGLLMIVN